MIRREQLEKLWQDAKAIETQARNLKLTKNGVVQKRAKLILIEVEDIKKSIESVIGQQE